MNLPDFMVDARLNRLRQQMGAELIRWSPESSWEPIQVTGLDIRPEDIKVRPRGTLEYNGRTVVVYIRDQYRSSDSGPEQLNRIHIADCKTLRQMRQQGKYKRYVVTTRTDGMFIVNFLGVFGSGSREEGVERRLYVCINCLNSLNYKGYRRFGGQKQKTIRDSFDLKEFFEMYSSQITNIPTDTDTTAPRNDYTLDWDNVSQRCREQAGWRCSNCQDYLGEDGKKRFLHVHHVDGVKYNNSNDNLQVLCIICHADIDNQLKHSPDYVQYQRIRQFGEPV